MKKLCFFLYEDKSEKYFIYTKNYFYDNWNIKKIDELIQYVLPSESLEILKKLKTYKIIFSIWIFLTFF